MKKMIFITLILSTLFMLTACKQEVAPEPSTSESSTSDPVPSKPEPSTSDPANADFDLETVLPAIQKTLGEYADGTIDTEVKENTEPAFMPLPEGVKLPEVTSADVLTYGGFSQGLGAYIVTTPCPDSKYTMSFLIVNLLMDDGKDYQVSSVSFIK